MKHVFEPTIIIENKAIMRGFKTLAVMNGMAHHTNFPKLLNVAQPSDTLKANPLQLDAGKTELLTGLANWTEYHINIKYTPITTIYQTKLQYPTDQSALCLRLISAITAISGERTLRDFAL